MTINIYNFCHGLNVADRNQFDVEDIMQDLRRFKSLAFNYPDQFRKAKSDFMNDIDIDARGPKEYKTIYNEMIRICLKYGRRSFTFNTLVRSISMVRKSKQQVTKARLESKTVPPAFDHYLRAEENERRRILKAELSNWLETTNDSFILELRHLIQKEWNKLQHEDYKIEILTNGSSTMLQWNGFNINDILSIVFVPDSQMDSDISKLGLRLKVANRYSEDDGFIYIKLNGSTIYDNCGGEHLEIPDKDAKVREIYRMFPWIQVVSKKLHKLLDKVARVLEGNYTYKHREWLKNIVKQGWNLTKYIIGADMTKYSDTLDRSFIIEILFKCGIPLKTCNLINSVYSKDIYDSTVVEILTGSLVTYQGQYGDFPMITICNLVLQRFLYYKVNQKCLPGYNAAVGDDTGLIFDKYDPIIMEYMVDIYGCVGVNINRDKTGELIYGKGRIDFVKLELDCMGVIEFLNTRSWNEDSVDAVVRDIIDLMYVDDDTRWKIADAMFGPGAGNRLSNLSIINGGLKDTPIDRRDLALYISRSQKIHNLTDYHPDDTHSALIKMKDYLNNEYDPNEKYYLGDTPLRGYLVEEDYLNTNNDPDLLDDMIIKRIMNMISIGLNEGNYKHLSSWLGVVPSEARKEWDKMIHGQRYDESLASIWVEISSYETFAAQRKGLEVKKNRRISTMLPVLMGLYDHIEEVDVPDYIIYEDKIVKASQDYNKMLRSYRANSNMKLIVDNLESVARFSVQEYFGIKYRYIYITTENGIIKRRLYDAERSKYYPLTTSEFEKYLYPYLKKYDIHYGDMWLSFAEADNWTFIKSDPLTNVGI